MMEYSWLWVMVVVIEGVFSWCEGTFWFNRRYPALKLPFLLHGGVVVGDLILLPYVFGMWESYFQIPVWLWGIIFFISLGITWFCHRAWWFMCETQPGFMYPDRSKSHGDANIWYRDMPASAWIHFGYMVVALMFIGAYIVTPMSAEIVWRTCWVFVIFVPAAIIEPGIVQGWPPKKKDIQISVGIALMLWAVVGLVTWAKLAHFLGI
jgi:hypothetical protein